MSSSAPRPGFPSTSSPVSWAFDHWIVDEDRRVLLHHGAERHLQPLLFDLLVDLLRHAPRVVTKDELNARVWNGDAVTDDALSVAISKLRRALGDRSRASRWIATVPRRGYRFRGEVRTLPRAALLEPATKAAIGASPPTSACERAEELAPPDSLPLGIPVRRAPGRLAGAAAVLLGALALVVTVPRWGLSGLELTRSPSEPDAEVAALLDRAGHDLQLRTPESLDRAEAALGRATRLSPRSADSWAELARALALRADLRLGDRLDLYHRARLATDEALRLDPDLPRARLADGTLLLFLEWRMEPAGRALEAARRELPNDPDAAQALSWWSSVRGDHARAIDEGRAAVDLDPASASRRADLAFVLLAAGQVDEARRTAREALDLDPQDASARVVGLRGALAAGAWEDAARAAGLRPTPEVAPEAAFWTGLGDTLGAAPPGAHPTWRAALAFRQGDTDAAWAHLERAMDRRDWEVLWIESLPELSDLREAPRFRELCLRRDRRLLRG